MPPAVILEGRRVRLEPLGPGHASDLARAAAESRDAYGFTLVPADQAAMTRYIQSALEDHRTGWALPFAVRDLSSGAVVGSTRFLDLDYWTWPPTWPPGRTTPRPDAVPTVAEIGSTWLAASAQRTGCNPEAKLLMLSHAFDTWGVLRVTLKTDSRNARSRRAIERIGGRFEGIRRAHARAVDGAVRDTAYYSIVAAEWPAAGAALKARLSALPALSPVSRWRGPRSPRACRSPQVRESRRVHTSVLYQVPPAAAGGVHEAGAHAAWALDGERGPGRPAVPPAARTAGRGAWQRTRAGRDAPRLDPVDGQAISWFG